MALLDYAALAVTVQTILNDGVGRSVSLVKYDRDPTSLADSTKPWRGSAKPRDEVTESPTVLSGVKATFAALGGYGFDIEGPGDDTKRAYKTCLVAGSDVTGNDLMQFDELWDSDGTSWRIKKVHQLGPGDTILLYGLELEQ